LIVRSAGKRRCDKTLASRRTGQLATLEPQQAANVNARERLAERGRADRGSRHPQDLAGLARVDQRLDGFDIVRRGGLARVEDDGLDLVADRRVPERLAHQLGGGAHGMYPRPSCLPGPQPTAPLAEKR